MIRTLAVTTVLASAMAFPALAQNANVKTPSSTVEKTTTKLKLYSTKRERWLDSACTVVNLRSKRRGSASCVSIIVSPMLSRYRQKSRFETGRTCSSPDASHFKLQDDGAAILQPRRSAFRSSGSTIPSDAEATRSHIFRLDLDLAEACSSCDTSRCPVTTSRPRRRRSTRSPAPFPDGKTKAVRHSHLRRRRTRSRCFEPRRASILQCLGAAVIAQWTELPTDVQKTLFEHAVSSGDPRHSNHLREQIARFLHNHKGNAPSQT